MSKLKAWVIETNYRCQIKAAYRKASDTELLIAKQELEKELAKRGKTKQ